MKYYKLFLCLIILGIVLYAFPRVLAHASTGLTISEGSWEIQPQPPRTIETYAALYGAPYKLALAIARCESQLNPLAKNPHSSAKGIFQFLDGSFTHYGLKHWGSLEGRSVLNYGDSAELGTWVIATYGTTPWDASIACWG